MVPRNITTSNYWDCILLQGNVLSYSVGNVWRYGDTYEILNLTLCKQHAYIFFITFVGIMKST